LIAHSATVDVKDKQGLTPLHLATFEKHVKSMELLLEGGARKKKKKKKNTNE
jgi:ankyrin repeat protein